MPEIIGTVTRAVDAPEPVLFAVGELEKYLKLISDADWSITEDQRLPVNALRVTIGVREPDITDAVGALLSGVTPDEGRLAQCVGIDAFAWHTGEGAVIVATNPRSVVFAVYDLLECLGCRFYGHGDCDEIVPSLGSSAVLSFLRRDARKFEQAAFIYRERHFLEWLDAESAIREVDVVAKRRMNAFVFHIEDFLPDSEVWRAVCSDIIPQIIKRGLLCGIGEHGAYPLWLAPERYAADHPEWYAEVDGRRVPGFRSRGLFQFCTQNESARSTFLDNMEAFLRAHPDITILHPSPEDMGSWCECEACASLSIADRYLALDKEIARRAVSLRNDMVIIHLVYATHQELPETEKLIPELSVSFIPFARDYGYPFADARTNQGIAGHPWSKALVYGWKDLCDQCGSSFIKHLKAMRMAWCTFHLLPLPHIADDMRWWRDLGIAGFNAPQEGYAAWVKHLNSYVIARLMWNPDLTVDSLLDDYFREYWGERAAEVRKVMEGIEHALPNLRYRHGQPTILSRRVRYTQQTPSLAESRRDSDYLLQAIERLSSVCEQAIALERGVSGPLAVRVRKLSQAISGALVALEVRQAMVHYQSALRDDARLIAIDHLKRANGELTSLQTEESRLEGTLWTGDWRGDEVIRAWENEMEPHA